ncbi:Leucine Rich Repeat [Seminavis robusta]|uniref:Leucine Rich Repeat n=1 Tax=Seminavis robusta TaxID=568900 RepID=A0A9N8E9N7_9STRA|nr:Leucine Rich Repeat [Seminavis robusta]|eukprot:Sro700_g189640.1 Leucine Rich Repeat (679) ;mRNA; f:29612-31947
MNNNKTQGHHGSGQQQQQAVNSFDALGKPEREVVIGNQHLIPFPDRTALDVSSPLTLRYVICGIPIPTLSAPAISQDSRPGAYSVAGIGPMLPHPTNRPLAGRIPDVEESGLELVPTSQQDRDRDDGLIHADPIDDSENGKIPTAEPITTRARRLWKKKLFLFLSLETMVAQVIVLIVLVAFLLSRKSSNQTQPSKQQNGVIPIQEHPATMPSITQAPISLWERLSLPEYTIRAMENPRSPQTKAYQWLSNNINKSNNTQHLPVWRLKQRFALATFYYSTRGDHWVKNQGWLDWDTNECNWAQIHPVPKTRCGENGQLLSFKFGSANNLDGTIPPEISLLSESMEKLSLSRNFQLKGNIPTEVGLLTRLTILTFSITHLSGTLPTELGQLLSLDELMISGSEFVGTLPTELGNLSNLTALGIQWADFSGSIPSEILGLSNLQTMFFFECPLLDTASFLPQVVGNLHNLELLGLSGRKTGEFTSIPSEIGKLTNLATLILKDFQLNGPLPSELAMLTNLNYLDLQRNSITGTLPQELSKMSQLGILLMSSNQLEGRPLEQDVLPQLTQLQWLHIDHNLFSGSIATEIGLMSSLEKLELQNTNLSGTLPTELHLLENLTSLVLMNASLSGSTPDGLCGVILSPHEMKFFGGKSYAVPTTNLSACYGTSLCGCTCENCPKA